MNKQISIIVAIASNYAIGKDNDLLWHISKDLKRFKKLTEGHYIIMGKKTYFSLPKRPLPNRTSIIITDVEGEVIDNCLMAYSIEDAIEKMEPERENFIIGGGSIYRQFLFMISLKVWIPKGNLFRFIRIIYTKREEMTTKRFYRCSHFNPTPPPGHAGPGNPTPQTCRGRNVWGVGFPGPPPHPHQKMSTAVHFSAIFRSNIRYVVAENP